MQKPLSPQNLASRVIVKTVCQVIFAIFSWDIYGAAENMECKMGSIFYFCNCLA